MFKFFSSFKRLVYFLIALISSLLCFTYFYLFFTGKMFELTIVKKLFDGIEERIVYRDRSVVKKEFIRVRRPVVRKTIPSSKIYKEPEENIYSWVDDSGIKHFSNLPPDDPSVNYTVEKSIVSRALSEVKTSMIKDGNSILVPVRISSAGQVRSTWLTLDTGATTTVIHDRVADKLSLSNTKWTRSRIADGSLVGVRQSAVDYIQVGPYRISNFRILVMDYKGPARISNGLLGMNFLKSVDYKIDYQRNLITWSRK